MPNSVRAEPASKSGLPELVEGLFFSLAPQRKNGASTSSARTGLGSSLFFHLQRAAADLVEFHRLEERGEIAFAEAFVLLALDEFEEDRADHRLAENLAQQPRVALGGRAVEQDRSEEHTSELQSLMRISYA